MRIPALCLIATTVASCTVAPPQQELAAQAAMEQSRLGVELAGRVAGAPVACLPAYATNRQTTISDNIILFRDAGTIYRNDPPGGCPGLGSGHYALLTQNPTGQLCRGDIAHVIDTQSHMIAGSCTFSDFVPYRRAG
jgi:hypothetical protein